MGPDAPILETRETLDDLVNSGKAGNIGTSIFAAWQLIDADAAGSARSEGNAGRARPGHSRLNGL
jgi:aryl-alcohol dehydrogenase-like predicted oxidoreductase